VGIVVVEGVTEVGIKPAAHRDSHSEAMITGGELKNASAEKKRRQMPERRLL